MELAKHPSWPSILAMACLFLLVTTTMNQSSAARSLGNSTPAPPHNHHKITFLMRNVLNVTQTSFSFKSKPATTKVTSHQLPFSKPIGLFPPNGAVPLPETNPTTQTLDISGIGLFFPARATLQELEFGTVTLIDEDIFESSGYGTQIVGKAQGIYVATSEDGSSHMMAMTAHFANSEFKDGLKFFGVHQTDHVQEGSHISVIGGIGKYVGANGYATVKAISTGSSATGEGGNSNILLMINVYLS